MRIIRASQVWKLIVQPKKKGEILSETAKAYLDEVAIALKYNRDPSFISKFTVKGVEQEEEALNVIRQTYQTDEYILKNEELFTKGPLSGTPDSITNLGVLDAKCSWSLFTFP